MRFKVELRDSVEMFLRHDCTDAEVDAFCRALQRVRDDPIKHSEPHVDPNLSR